MIRNPAFLLALALAQGGCAAVVSVTNAVDRTVLSTTQASQRSTGSLKLRDPTTLPDQLGGQVVSELLCTPTTVTLVSLQPYQTKQTKRVASSVIGGAVLTVGGSLFAGLIGAGVIDLNAANTAPARPTTDSRVYAFVPAAAAVGGLAWLIHTAVIGFGSLSHDTGPARLTEERLPNGPPTSCGEAPVAGGALLATTPAGRNFTYPLAADGRFRFLAIDHALDLCADTTTIGKPLLLAYQGTQSQALHLGTLSADACIRETSSRQSLALLRKLAISAHSLAELADLSRSAGKIEQSLFDLPPTSPSRDALLAELSEGTRRGNGC